jgi:hypothetical protein
MKMKMSALCAICSLASMMATIAYGQTTAALTGVDETYVRSMTGSAGQGYSLGWEFGMTQNAQVSALGLLDLGFTSGHSVGIWSITGVLLGEATVSESATPDSNGFAWATLGSDINLSAGQDYVIAAWYPTDSGSCDNFVTFGTSPTTSSAVNYLNAETSDLMTGFGAPEFVNSGWDAGIFGPNFQYTSSVPEPSILGLASFGIAAVLWQVRRRRVA